jgi:hypothetical protein
VSSKRVVIDEEKYDTLAIYCTLTGTSIRDAVDAALELWLAVEAEVDLETVTASQHTYPVPVPVSLKQDERETARPKVIPMMARAAAAR